MGSSSPHFGFESFSDFFPFFAEASSSVKVGKFCLFGVVGRGLDSATTGVEPRGGIAFLTVRSGDESSRLLLSFILSKFRDGVVEQEEEVKLKVSQVRMKISLDV